MAGQIIPLSATNSLRCTKTVDGKESQYSAVTVKSKVAASVNADKAMAQMSAFSSLTTNPMYEMQHDEKSKFVNA